MNANPDTSSASGRRTSAQDSERSDAVPDHASQNSSSHDTSKEDRTLPKGWAWKTIPELISDEGVFVDGDWVESKDQDPDGDVRLIQLADVGDGFTATSPTDS
jgi:hypothetical protein